MIDGLIMPVFVMLDNSLFDKHKQPLETQSSGNNERMSVDIAWSLGNKLQCSAECSQVWILTPSASGV